jgi:hypothetical protein
MQIKPIGPNQTELHTEGKIILFSYETPVAAYFQGKYYRTSRKYSTTTSRHINAWLRDNPAETVDPTYFISMMETAKG